MMKPTAVVFMSVLALSGCKTAATMNTDSGTSASGVNAMISSWPATPQDVARTTMAKYGPPNEATPTMLVWHDNGPWKRTIVYRDEVQHDFPKPHTDLLQQFIDYQVPLGKYDDLARYDGSVVVERTNGELSARCDKEGMNFLAINLAHDVASGKRSVEDARRFYTETAMAAMKGDMRPYTQRLQFDVRRGGTADADKPAMK